MFSLKETLEEYHVMMIGYNSPSFEPKYSSNRPTYQSNLDYWLEKIWVVEGKIEKIELEIKRFDVFVSQLNDIEKNIIKGLIKSIPIKELTTKNNIDRQTYYYYYAKIEKKYKTIRNNKL